MTQGISKAAYQGDLICPHVLRINGEFKECGSKALRLIEHLTPTRLRYRCRKCGNFLQYDISNRLDLNPYAPFRKGRIWGNIMKVTQGRQLKGELQ